MNMQELLSQYSIDRRTGIYKPSSLVELETFPESLTAYLVKGNKGKRYGAGYPCVGQVLNGSIGGWMFLLLETREYTPENVKGLCLAYYNGKHDPDYMLWQSLTVFRRFVFAYPKACIQAIA